ncbi:hypothetical protein Trydic_g19594 [Trypoxylus dichotomus]
MSALTRTYAPAAKRNDQYAGDESNVGSLGRHSANLRLPLGDLVLLLADDPRPFSSLERRKSFSISRFRREQRLHRRRPLPYDKEVQNSCRSLPCSFRTTYVRSSFGIIESYNTITSLSW